MNKLKISRTVSIVAFIILMIGAFWITGPHMSQSEAIKIVEDNATKLVAYENRVPGCNFIIVNQDTLDKYEELNLAVSICEISLNYKIKIEN